MKGKKAILILAGEQYRLTDFEVQNQWASFLGGPEVKLRTIIRATGYALGGGITSMEALPFSLHAKDWFLDGDAYVESMEFSSSTGLCDLVLLVPALPHR